MKEFSAGQLIKCHAGTKVGGRGTALADLPSERTDWASPVWRTAVYEA